MRLGVFSSHHGIKLACGPEHMAGERVSRWHSQESAFFRREREREIQEERGIQEDGAFKSAENFFIGRGEVCPGYLISAF